MGSNRALAGEKDGLGFIAIDDEAILFQLFQDCKAVFLPASLMNAKGWRILIPRCHVQQE